MYLPVRTERGEIDGVMMFETDVTEQVLARRRVGEQTAALTRDSRSCRDRQSCEG